MQSTTEVDTEEQTKLSSSVQVYPNMQQVRKRLRMQKGFGTFIPLFHANPTIL